MNRILLQRQSVHRKFISFRQEHDGSLYITFNRKGITNSTAYYRMSSLESAIEEVKVVEGQIPKKFEIHYHTTGRVNLESQGDVDENNHFTSLGNSGRRFLCLGKRD